MIAYFWPFVIMKSLKQNNEVTEMKLIDSLCRTGETVVLAGDRAESFRWVRFDSLDAPNFMPAGSMVFLECLTLDPEGVVCPMSVPRGW